MKNLILSTAVFMFVGLTTFAQDNVSKDKKSCDKKCETKATCKGHKCDKNCEMKCGTNEATGMTTTKLMAGVTADSKMVKEEKQK